MAQQEKKEARHPWPFKAEGDVLVKRNQKRKPGRGDRALCFNGQRMLLRHGDGVNLAEIINIQEQSDFIYGSILDIACYILQVNVNHSIIRIFFQAVGIPEVPIIKSLLTVPTSHIPCICRRIRDIVVRLKVALYQQVAGPLYSDAE